MAGNDCDSQKRGYICQGDLSTTQRGKAHTGSSGACPCCSLKQAAHFIIYQSISERCPGVYTQSQTLLTMQIFCQLHLRLSKWWENYLIINFNNFICFTTSLLSNSVSGHILAILHHKEKGSGRLEKMEEAINLVHAESRSCKTAKQRPSCI